MSLLSKKGRRQNDEKKHEWYNQDIIGVYLLHDILLRQRSVNVPGQGQANCLLSKNLLASLLPQPAVTAHYLHRRPSPLSQEKYVCIEAPQDSSRNWHPQLPL
jgi:hypothetical protein